MNSVYRPMPVLIIAYMYIAVGSVGFVRHFHFNELMAFRQDSVWVEPTELLAIISGAFMLRGHNWARWLAFAWMAFHVAISFPVLRDLAAHSVILALVFWTLFRSESRRYFDRPGTDLVNRQD